MIPILMLTKDRLNLTRKALTMLLRHTPGEFRAVVFDNASDDGTQEWLTDQILQDRTGNLMVHFSPVNVGIQGGMDWFHDQFPDVEFYAKVDNDTVVPHNWLNLMFPIMENVGADLVGCKHYTCSQGALDAMQKAEKDGFAPFPSPGGSGIIYRRRYVEGRRISNPEYSHSMMDGWTNYCHEMWRQGARSGFCGNVFVTLLDMEDHFKRKEGQGDTCAVLGTPSLR